MQALSKLEKFLIKCGGGDVQLLEYNGIKPDINKVAGIGGSVLFTGIFATFSFGFAMSWVFPQPYIYITLGILWGMMIFNLDRLIVSGSLKTKKNIAGYYLNFIIRLALAVGISLIISVPLEMKIFQSMLVAQTIKIEQKNSTALKDIKDNIKELEDQYHKETAGKGLTGKIGDGPVAKNRKQRLTERENDLINKSKEIENAFATNQNSLGFLERYRALESLKDSDKNIMLISNCIMLLFLLIEIIPILVKTFSTDAVYEDSLKDKIQEVKNNFLHSEMVAKM